MNDAKRLIEELVEGFLARGWKYDPMTPALRLAATWPEAVADLAKAVMERVPKGGTFLDAALLFLPENRWPEVVRSAVGRLAADPQNEAAESVVAYASLQCPRAVHPFLADLFVINERYRPYYGIYAWRGAGDEAIDFLLRKLREAPAPPPADAKRYRTSYGDTRFRAFEGLLETRNDRALREAAVAAPGLGLTSDQLRDFLWRVDREPQEGGFRRLVPEVVYHVQFPDGYVELPSFLQPWPIPTWKRPSPVQAVHRFGGTVSSPCGVCGEALHHLLTIPQPLASELGVTGVSQVVLATCLSCLGWDGQPLFYSHDAEGRPAAHASGSPRAPEFPSAPLQETRVAITPAPARWRWQDWSMSNGRENLHRLGGSPCWVQSADYPSCPDCRRTMSFLIQLDSELKLADGGAHLWGSGGIGYLFWCDDCRISAATWQCT